MTEYLLGIFWAFTYVLIIVGGFKYRHENRLFMPLVAGALNFAWEIHALCTSGGYWIHVIWLSLDIVILFQNIYFLSKLRNRLIYCVSVLLSILLVYQVFHIPYFNGMLVSSFVIDVIMACEYVVVIKKISPHIQITIGILRLLGDIFAWITNMRYSMFVMIAGIVVLLTNLFYLSYALEILSLNKGRAKNNK